MNGEKVIDLLWEVKEGKKHPNKAYKELCVLFNVVGQSEQLVCDDCGYEINPAGICINMNCSTNENP